ncbi:MAG: hypothetical protein F2789_13040, partial [Actinobacteria bacterium]|nr:hypothetical protein [Actinomycetota bacterium]
MMLRKASALLIALAVVGTACSSDKKSDTTTPAGGTTASGDTLIIATDLPLQGANADASKDTNNAIELLLEQAGGKAGAFNVAIKAYD